MRTVCVSNVVKRSCSKILSSNHARLNWHLKTTRKIGLRFRVDYADCVVLVGIGGLLRRTAHCSAGGENENYMGSGLARGSPPRMLGGGWSKNTSCAAGNG